jgi:hypothetical protein
MRSYLTTVKLVLVAALVAVAGIEHARMDTARRHAAAAQLAMVNLAAERDSTRDAALSNGRLAALAGDSLRIVERKVVQVSQRSDAVDRALGRERRGFYRMGAVVEPLQEMASGASTLDSSRTVRSATFSLRHEPYTVEAQVEIPVPPDSAHIEMRVALDTIPIAVRLYCTAADANGVRTASIVASSPRWAAVRFDRVEQESGLCSAGAAPPSRSAQGFVVSPAVGAGRVMTLAGRWSWTVFLGGVIYWT